MRQPTDPGLAEQLPESLPLGIPVAVEALVEDTDETSLGVGLTDSEDIERVRQRRVLGERVDHVHQGLAQPALIGAAEDPTVHGGYESVLLGEHDACLAGLVRVRRTTLDHVGEDPYRHGRGLGSTAPDQGLQPGADVGPLVSGRAEDVFDLPGTQDVRLDARVQPVRGPPGARVPHPQPTGQPLLVLVEPGVDTQFGGDAQNAVLVRQRRTGHGAGPDLPGQELVRPTDRLLDPSGKQTEIGGRVLGGCQFWKRVDDERRRLLDHLLVEGRGVEEILPVLVGLPGTVEDAAQRHLVLGGEEGPEPAAPTGPRVDVQTAFRVPLQGGNTPGQSERQPVVEFAGVGPCRWTGLVGGGEHPPALSSSGLSRPFLAHGVQIAGVPCGQDPASHRAGATILQDHLRHVW